MNEPEILEAYRDLSSPTSPPDDLLTRVDRRIHRRRATRRALAGVAALAIAGGIGVVTLGGDDGGGSLVADQGGTGTSTLTYTDVDGSTYTFDAADLELTCPTPEPGGRQRLILSRGGDETQPILYADFVVDEVEPGEVFHLPVDGPGGSDTYPMVLFFTNGTDDGANELSSAMDATGTVTVHEAACGPTPSLWFEVDATLGSEVEQPALAIEGSYRS